MEPCSLLALVTAFKMNWQIGQSKQKQYNTTNTIQAIQVYMAGSDRKKKINYEKAYKQSLIQVLLRKFCIKNSTLVKLIIIQAFVVISLLLCKLWKSDK